MEKVGNFDDFPTIGKLAHRIAGLYKFMGLVSIVLLTIVTTVSLTNVFTGGKLSGNSLVTVAWSVIFSAAIEVNVVRLFFEARFEALQSGKTKGLTIVGLGLAVVAGASLLIEGLQQSLHHFDFNNDAVQWTIGVIISLRVLFVVVLLAREGGKLADLVHGHLLREQGKAKPGKKEAGKVEMPEAKPELPKPGKLETGKVTDIGKVSKLDEMLTRDPSLAKLTNRELGNLIGVSHVTAGKWKDKWLERNTETLKVAK